MSRKMPSYAERAVRLLEEQLRGSPPPGISPERVSQFFAEFHDQLVQEVEGLVAQEVSRQGLVLLLRADPNPDFGAGTHQASVQIAPQWVRVGSLAEAQQRALAFIRSHDLGGGNWTGGDVFREGKPYARVSYNGRIWDAQSEGELDGQGRPVPSPICSCNEQGSKRPPRRKR